MVYFIWLFIGWKWCWINTKVFIDIQSNLQFIFVLVKHLSFVIKKLFVLKNIQLLLQILVVYVHWNRWQASIVHRLNILWYISYESDRCISVIILKIYLMEVIIHWKRLKMKRMIYVDRIWLHVRFIDPKLIIFSLTFSSD